MFDTLLKPKFYSKCKSCVKLTKTRLEAIRKKRNAVQKFLKKDIAELLRNGLDYNAYGRAEGLLVEQNMSACYEFIAKFVGCISDHVRYLCKHKDCPDECKEAIPSLVYAAARFSDLPELRDMRTLFTEKYGNSIEPYISKEFVEKLRQNPPSKEMKIQLLHDVAQEFSIEWDSKALEQRLYSPTLLHEEMALKHLYYHPKLIIKEKPEHDPQNDYGDEKWNGNNGFATPTLEDKVNGGKQRDGRDFHTSEGIKRDTLTPGRKGMTDDSWRMQSSSNEERRTNDNSSQDGSKACSSSLQGVVSEDGVEEVKKPFSYGRVPPPYVKENSNKNESDLKKTTSETSLPEKESSNHDLHEPVIPKKPIPKSVRRRPLKKPSENNNPSLDSKTGDSKLADNGDSKDAEKKQSLYESGIGKACTESYPFQQNRMHTNSNLVRGTSLPPFEDTSSSSKETLRWHGRATSLGPEMLSTVGHVHPSLPEYDDLAARLAALRER